MDKYRRYCTNCNRYYTYKHKCDTPVFIYIRRTTRRIVDRLQYLGFKVLSTNIIPDMDFNSNNSDFYRTRIEVNFKLAYSDSLLAELPEGWCWEVNTIAPSSLVYTVEIKRNEIGSKLTQQLSNQAIIELEKYLKARNAEGIRTAMLLMYD
ncbi:hypothetical protein [Clostridium sp. OS1-26]|uniref:hypothetical protein n=1 Tax=Clostridium sp. OS1-26 TaxID=3070681 RepID=UPI0027DFB296|nr:hypothetical protein [Clostridium sp. OS1-26]WML36950.1 hypothetical protein RCG18_10205 [Clostridium sp. OS1-26]